MTHLLFLLEALDDENPDVWHAAVYGLGGCVEFGGFVFKLLVRDKTSNAWIVDIEANNGMDNFRPFSVLLMPHSLLIFKDDVYLDYLHGIEVVKYIDLIRL